MHLRRLIEPEKFTDARRAELEPTSTSIVGELQKFLITTGARYVPENMKLNTLARFEAQPYCRHTPAR